MLLLFYIYCTFIPWINLQTRIDCIRHQWIIILSIQYHPSWITSGNRTFCKTLISCFSHAITIITSWTFFLLFLLNLYTTWTGCTIGNNVISRPSRRHSRQFIFVVLFIFFAPFCSCQTIEVTKVLCFRFFIFNNFMILNSKFFCFFDFFDTFLFFFDFCSKLWFWGRSNNNNNNNN